MRSWGPADGRRRVPGRPLSLREAATWLQRASGHPLRQPVGVIGPRDAPEENLPACGAIGGASRSDRLHGRVRRPPGLMEAVCRGVAASRRDQHRIAAGDRSGRREPVCDVPLATGIGEARNAIIARSAFCLVAIGDSYGTLSEVALGLQFGKPVIGLAGAAQVDGVRHVATADDAVDAVARIALGL